MRCLSGQGSRLARVVMLAALLLPAGPLGAQPAGEGASPQGPPLRRDVPIYSLIAVISPDELFHNSAFGRFAQARTDERRRALQAENQELEAALETEERDLTQRRQQMTPEAFRPLADAFDEKVKQIRANQEGKARDLLRDVDETRERFITAATPVLKQLMVELGAMVVLDRDQVVVSLDAVDITDRAISQIDASLGDGSAGATADPSQPAGAAP